MNWADLHFLRPHWLWALIALAVFIRYLVRQQQRAGDWATICDAELLPFILQNRPNPQNRQSWWFASLAMMLVIVALAGPTWQRLPGPVFKNESPLVIALDLSKSMDAADVKPSRLGKARFKIADLLKLRKDGQTALLVYSGDAFTVTPLTSDTATIASQLGALNTDIMPSPGNNTGVALQKAVALLKQANMTHGHILLVCDDVDAASLSKAKQTLGEYRLSVLGVGSADGAPIKQEGGGFLKDDNGNIVVARLDEADLSNLAQQGGGIYQLVRNDDADIERLSAEFNPAPQDGEATNSNQQMQQWAEFGPWLILLVLPWAALRFRKGLLLWLLCAALPSPDAQAFDWQSLWKNADQRGQQAFEQKQFDQAAQQFNDPQWRAAAQYKAGQYEQAAEALKDINSADAHYNRGNALAKAGQLQPALDAYQQTLKLDPNHQDAQHNKKLVEEQLKKQQQKQDQSPQSDDQKQQQKSDQQQQSQDGQSKDQPQKDQDQQNQSKDQQQSSPSDADQQHKPAQDPPKQEADKNQQQPKDQQPSSKEPQKADDKPTEANAKQATEAKPEDKQAEQRTQQLLKRIPDEPTGLLKRKFRYQYQDRRQTPNNGTAW